jgi:hypothetical protein
MDNSRVKQSAVETPLDASVLGPCASLGRSLSFGPIEYDRSFSSKNCRVSVATFQLWLFDAAGQSIHTSADARPELTRILNTILCWKASEWSVQLASSSSSDSAVTLRTKSDFFWESLSQHISERVFALHKTEHIFLFGPGPRAKRPEQGSGGDGGIANADRLVISTFVDGRRDPINPQSRRITFDVTRGTMFDPDITLEVYPFMHGATTKPLIGVVAEDEAATPTPTPTPTATATATATTFSVSDDLIIRAHIPRGRRQLLRIQNTDYCDFNLVFIPLRHLVFEEAIGGDGEQAMVTGATRPRSYADMHAFHMAVTDVLARSRRAETSSSVCDALAPYLTEAYYGNYLQSQDAVADHDGDDKDDGCDNNADTTLPGDSLSAELDEAGRGKGKGLTHFEVAAFGLLAFREFMLGPYGIGGGLAPDFGDVELSWAGRIFRYPELACVEKPTEVLPLPIHGGCGCGKVRFVTRCDPRQWFVCHCSQCPSTERTYDCPALGPPGASWIGLPRAQWYGRKYIQIDRTSPFATRSRCVACKQGLSMRYDCEDYTDWMSLETLVGHDRAVTLACMPDSQPLLPAPVDGRAQTTQRRGPIHIHTGSRNEQEHAWPLAEPWIPDCCRPTNMSPAFGEICGNCWLPTGGTAAAADRAKGVCLCEEPVLLPVRA